MIDDTLLLEYLRLELITNCSFFLVPPSRLHSFMHPAARLIMQIFRDGWVALSTTETETSTTTLEGRSKLLTRNESAAAKHFHFVFRLACYISRSFATGIVLNQ